MHKFLTVLLILINSGSITQIGFAKVHQRSLYKSGSLVLEGQVKSLEKDSEDSHFFNVKATLLLTFKNVGRKPVILYRHNLWLGGIRLSRTVEDARAYKFIHDSSAWPSNWGSQSQLKLRKALDQPSPPADLTLILQPGESWQYETDTSLSIDKKEGPTAHGRTWEEIRSASPIWLLVTFEMWPINAEPKLNPDNPEFGLALRKRWESSGELWLDYLTSQPIALDFNELKTAAEDVQ